MIRLMKYEYLKIIRQPFLIILFSLLIVLNGSFLFYKIYVDNSEGFSAADIASVYKCIEKNGAKKPIEMETWLQQLIAQSEEENLEESLELYNYVLTQVESINSYEEYWDTLMSGGNSISALLEDKFSFSGRNITKTRQAYQQLQGLTINLECSEGVVILTQSGISEQLILGFLFCLILLLTSKEKEEGYTRLTVSMKRGKTCQIMAKYLTLILTTVIITVICFGMNVLFLQYTLGLGNLSRSIQSVYGYQSCPYLLCVGNYLVLHFIIKCISMIVAVSIFFLFGIIGNGMLQATMYAVIDLILSFLLWEKISPYSWLCILHYFNLFHIFDVQTILGDYRNINIAGYPVNQLVIYALFTGISILGSVIISSRVYGRNKQSSIILQCKIQTRLNKKIKLPVPKSLSGFEWYKLLVINRGFILLSLLAISSMIFAYREPFYMNGYEAAYEKYCTQMEGNLSSEKKAYLEEEKLRMEEDGLDIPEERQEALKQAYKQYQKLEERKNSGLKVTYFSQTGWERYLGKYGRQKDCQIAGLLTLILLLSSFRYVTMENENHMEQIMNVIEKGADTVYHTKMKILIIYAFFLMVIAFVPYTIRFFTYYQMGNWMSYTGSLLLFQEQWGFLRILTFFVLYWLCRLVGIFASVAVIYFCQRLTKNRIATLLLIFFLLLLPIGTTLLGITGEWGLLPFVTGHAILSLVLL